MPWKCPVCGHINPDDKEFCEVCGAKRPENPETVSEAEAVKLQEPRETGQAETLMAGGEASEPSEAAEGAAVEEEAAVQGGEEAEAAEATEASEAQAPAEPVAEEAGGEAVAPAKEAEEKLPETIYLEVVNSPASELVGKKIPVMLRVFPRISIGRSPDNVIIFPDPTVSRRHAVIRVEEGKLILEDLGSTNGTYVYNSETGGFEKVERVELKPGMIVRFGEQTIVRIVTEPA